MSNTERLRTHWEDCWRDRSHHECAVAMVERLTRLLQHAGDQLDETAPRWRDISKEQPPEGLYFMGAGNYWNFLPITDRVFEVLKKGNAVSKFFGPIQHEERKTDEEIS